ncbi:MAG: DUF2784 domain-containing protein [Candidatus Hydrogenedens sp.]|nr:DUF2784 domain-containing protein [Candidatus Hydrogenedens sp.]
MFYLKIADVLLTVIHLIFIVFILFGWIPIKLRKVHYISMWIVFISWFLLGLYFGLGYCPLTDLHWKIKIKLNEVNLPYSFIKYILDRITKNDFDETMINYVTVVVFIFIFILSTYFFIKDKRSKKTT